MESGGTGKSSQFRARSSLRPWKSPQSNNTRAPACSSRYLDPVTVRAAPRNVSFATHRRYQASGLRPQAPGIARDPQPGGRPALDRRPCSLLSFPHGRSFSAPHRDCSWSRGPDRLARGAGAAARADRRRDLRPGDAGRLQRIARNQHHLGRCPELSRVPARRRRLPMAEGGRGVGPFHPTLRQRAHGGGDRGTARRHRVRSGADRALFGPHAEPDAHPARSSRSPRISTTTTSDPRVRPA